MKALELRNVTFAYKLGHQKVPALNGISLSIEQGEMVAIQGPSGSGKSTLLYLLGCMLKPDSGQILVNGADVNQFNEVQLAYFRNRQLGFVFQQFHLLPGTDILNNILLPAHYPMEQKRESEINLRDRAVQLAQRLGLGERLGHKPHELSGGQQQRVAIARALIRDAPVILADEPTGNLDSKTAQEILKLLRELNAQGKTVVIITHDNEVASKCDRIIYVRDGRVEGQKEQPGGEPPRKPAIPDLGKLGWDVLLRESLPRAAENLKRNRLRSFLTMLGVVVGVASILAMLTLGDFTKNQILKSYATNGVNTLIFNARINWFMKAIEKPPNVFKSLDLDRDVKPLKEIFPEFKFISPLYSSYRHSAVYGGRSVDEEVSLLGVNEDAFKITRRELAMGGGIQKFHVDNKSSVCVIGSDIAQRLFQRENPLNQALQVSIDELTFSCVIVGVSKPVFSKETRFGPNLQVILPYTYFNTLPMYYWDKQLRQMLIEVDAHADVEEAGKKIQALFEKRYGKSGFFQGSSDSVLIAQMKRFLNLFTMLLVSIAALSLLVGGMGITNMMLVSVNERLREIGLRKALGASHSAIRQLFFAESLFLCLIAGLIGVAVGFAGYQSLIYMGSKLIPDFTYQWVFNPWAIAVSLAAIVLTGILSGFGPALRAEKLQVIEALRAE